VETTVTPTHVDSSVVEIQGELKMFTRVADIVDDLPFLKEGMESIQNRDLLLFAYEVQHSAENENDYLTLEVAFLGTPEDRFLVNLGGVSAVKKIVSAFEKVNLGLVTGPLCASFRKIITGNGRSFWQVD